MTQNIEKAIATDVGGTDYQDTILQNLRRVKEDDSRRMGGDEIFSECFSTFTNTTYQSPANNLRPDLNFAGPSSTAAALTAILYELGSHPEAQHRLYDEVRTPGPDKAASSSFLDGVLKETLRLNPPFPSVFPRYIRSGAENLIPICPPRCQLEQWWAVMYTSMADRKRSGEMMPTSGSLRGGCVIPMILMGKLRG